MFLKVCLLISDCTASQSVALKLEVTLPKDPNPVILEDPYNGKLPILALEVDTSIVEIITTPGEETLPEDPNPVILDNGKSPILAWKWTLLLWKLSLHQEKRLFPKTLTL